MRVLTNPQARLTNRPSAVAGGGEFGLQVTDDIVAYYKMEGPDGPGGTWSDSTGNGHHLTPFNVPITTPGVVNDAGRFASASLQYLESAPSLFNHNQSTTIAWWFKRTATGSQTEKYPWIYTSTIGSTFFAGAHSLAGSTAITMGWDASFPGFTVGDTLGSYPIGTWFFVCGGYDQTLGQAWITINGTATGLSDPIYPATPPVLNTPVFRISRAQTQYGDFDIDEVSIHQRRLSYDEVSYLYNGGAGRTWVGGTIT